MAPLPPETDAAWLPWIAPFFGLLGFRFLSRAFDRRPRLLVDLTGVTDRTSLVGGTLHIPWGEVRSISEFRSGALGITVRDPFETRSKAGFVRRLWMGLGHLLLGQERILIPTTLLGITKAELQERLDAHLLFFEVGELTQTLSEGASG